MLATLTTPPPIVVPVIVVAPPAVVVTVDISAVAENLPLLIANLPIVLTGFAPISLAQLAVALPSQLFELVLIAAQFFALPMIARRVRCNTAGNRNHQRSRQ